jgi:type I restriction enzyme S subunit
MKMYTKDSSQQNNQINFDEQRRIVAYLDSVQARLASLRELQSATGEELDALLPSVLDRAFKGEL